MEASTGAKPLVFAVDDDEDILELYRVFLAPDGYRLETFTSGTGLVEMVRRGAPEAVLLDVMMSGENGFELCRALKNDPGTCLVPIVMVTALDGKDERIRGIDAGADEFLSKPINREELRARVRSLLRLHETRRALEGERLEAETRKREALRRTFERYVSPNLVARILERGDLSLGSDDRIEAVALFADLRGFTRLAETLPPRVVVGLLNEFFSRITAIAFRHDGTVFNMAGDCLFVGFGVPLPLAHPERCAVAAAREMITEFEAISGAWRAAHGVSVGIGIGINAGDVIAGDIGSPSYTSFTIIGDAVNVAARLMQAAASGEVVVSQAVRDAVDGEEWLPPEPLNLKGRSAAVIAHRLRPRRLATA